MDRDEKRKNASVYANTPIIDGSAEPVLATPSGRDRDTPRSDDAEISGASSDFAEEANRRDVGAIPRSAITAYHQPGMGAQENEDGLSDSEEETRHFAEDIGTGDGREDTRELPVFDRGSAPPKL
jgi:hypothetical protein